MKIVHLATSSPVMQNRPSKKDLELASAKRFVEVQEHSNYRKALLDNKAEIEIIRIRDKNFTPKRV